MGERIAVSLFAWSLVLAAAALGALIAYKLVEAYLVPPL